MEASIIFFDIDGTIIDAAGNIPASAVSAIRGARERGTLCVVNTGRPMAHIDPKVIAIGFDGYICSCGQHIVWEDRVALHAEFTPEQCRAVAEWCRRCRLDAVYESERGIWFDMTHPMTDVIRSSREQFARRGFDVEHSVEDADFGFDKFCVFIHEDSDVESFLRFAEPFCTVIFREGKMLEVIRKGFSKQSGLNWVIEQLGIPSKRCYAIGDSTNDLPMLSSVAHGIAMGNAPEEVKAVVEYVTAALQEDGVAQALRHFGL